MTIKYRCHDDLTGEDFDLLYEVEEGTGVGKLVPNQGHSLLNLVPVEIAHAA